MIKFKRKYIGYIVMGFIAALVATFFPLEKNSSPDKEETKGDSREIQQTGTIRVAMEYNSISYFVNKDSVAGFDYELLQQFCKDKKLTPEITVEMSYEKRLAGLMDGSYDLMAFPIPATSQLKDSILLSEPILLNKQILVQRKRKNEDDSTYISTILELKDKTIHLIKGSPSIARIQHLSNEIGAPIYLEEIDKYGTEQLLSMVAHGDIDYLVCEESIALASRDQFPELDLTTPLSFTQFYAWGIHKDNTILADTLNAWLKEIRNSSFYKDLYRNYYSGL